MAFLLSGNLHQDADAIIAAVPAIRNYRYNAVLHAREHNQAPRRWNSWIVYRSIHNADLLRVCAPDGSFFDESAAWSACRGHYYEQLVNEVTDRLALEHRALFPTYRYKPKRTRRA